MTKSSQMQQQTWSPVPLIWEKSACGAGSAPHWSPKAWLRAEAAKPVQHSELVLSREPEQWPPDPVDIGRLRWELRDASRLLDLAFEDVAPLLTLQPVLTGLQSLTLRDWDYTYEQAEQLSIIGSLKNLQVCHLLNCP